MLATDDSLGELGLRQAFHRFLQKRIDAVRRRVGLLARGWDVNLLAKTAGDVRELSGAALRFEQAPLSAQLDSLSALLDPLLDSLAAPSADELEQMRSVAAALVVPRPPREVPVAGTAETAERFELPRAGSGIPLAVAPPQAFVERFARPVDARAPTVVPRTAPATMISATDLSPELAAELPASMVAAPEVAQDAPTPAVVAPARPAARPRDAAAPGEGRRVYQLTDGNPLATELSQRLEAQGYELAVLDAVDELKEMVRSLTPSLVIVDAAYVDRLEEIGQAVRLARPRSSGRLALLALAPSGDVPLRLKAMRAGVDSFVALPAPAADVMSRVAELLETDESEPFRVMIIEDDRSQALFAESILRKAGMRTCAVTDPLGALDALEEFAPELILMDLYMPDCDGMELTALIRERERFINTPIVFLSGEHDVDKRFDALSAGGDDYLEKPIRPKYLISAVTNRVRRARALNRRVVSVNPRDQVSGLYERAHVIGRVAATLASGEGTNLGGLLFVIIDGAQAIRERIGLSAFDALLGQAGALLAGLVSGTDLAARYGDTSFIVLAPGHGEQSLLRFGEEIRARFERHLFDIGDKSLTLAVSIGIATFAAGWDDAGAVLNAAERACALARTAPERKVRVFERDAVPASADEAEGLLAAINDALRYDRFQLLFQPIASLHGSSEEQFQVLLRLRGDRGRLYTAAEVVPVAESAGLIGQVDRWVLSRCLMVLQERDRIDRPVRLFVSQSVGSLADTQRLGWLTQQLAQRQLVPDRLVLEFRAQEALSRLREVGAFVAQARAAGFGVGLTGYEGTAAMQQMLQHLEVDYLKLAGRYVGEGPETRRDLQEVIAFAHQRAMRVIAPLVEDARTAAGLWTSGVDFIQGDFVQQATQDLEFDFRASAT
jgi:diguanylate cyclase (GGDEF)-like protein